MPPEKDNFDFFRDLTEVEQNHFLEEYLTKTTRYLKEFEFPHSPGCYYYLPQFHDDEYHGNSISNLASLLVLLMQRDYLLPFHFKGQTEREPVTGTLQVYYFFTSWPIGNLHDLDFEAIELLQDDELREYTKILEN